MRTPLEIFQALCSLSFNGATARQFWGPFVFFLLLLFPLICVCLVFKDEVCNQPEYYVTVDNIRVYNPPPWIDQGFVYEALRLLPAEYREERQNADLPESIDDDATSQDLRQPPTPEKNAKQESESADLFANENDLVDFKTYELKLNLNSNDPLLVENLRIAFQKHALVESVKSIEIQYPAIVNVRLVFRAPTAVVDPSPKLRQEFLNDLSAEYPDDFGFFLEQEKIRRAQNPDDAQNEETETANIGGRFLIDRTGLKLPTPYFRRHPGSYETLPVIVGLRNSSASAHSDQLLRESSLIARFFQEVDPESHLQIEKFEVLRVYNSKHGIWFLKTRSGAMVKWGRFVRKAASDAPGTPSPFVRADQKDDWDELKNFQKRKLARFLELVKENDYDVQKAKLSDNEGERNAAEKLRIRFYDVSDALLGEEDESE